MMQSVSGYNSLLNIKPYEIGTMQETVYNVRGGFEDWAYGASWDKKNINEDNFTHEKFN